MKQVCDVRLLFLRLQQIGDFAFACLSCSEAALVVVVSELRLGHNLAKQVRVNGTHQGVRIRRLHLFRCLASGISIRPVLVLTFLGI